MIQGGFEVIQVIQGEFCSLRSLGIQGDSGDSGDSRGILLTAFAGNSRGFRVFHGMFFIVAIR